MAGELRRVRIGNRWCGRKVWIRIEQGAGGRWGWQMLSPPVSGGKWVVETISTARHATRAILLAHLRAVLGIRWPPSTRGVEARDAGH